MIASLRAIASRIQKMFSSRRDDEEFSHELGAHLEMLTDENIRRGMSPAEARRQAHIRLGASTQLREMNRDLRGLPFLETLWQDLRYGLRMLRKSPGFTAVAVLTLALGIGANTAIFSVVNGVLLAPMRYVNADRLVSVYATSPHTPEGPITYANFLDWEKLNSSFDHLAAFRSQSFNLTGSGESERLRGYMVSADFFSVFGAQLTVGRVFRSDEDHLGATPVALISEGLWRRKFAANPEVVGESILLNGKSHTIIGVVPSSFYLFDNQRDIYVPIGQSDEPAFHDRKVSFGALAIGRLRPGVSLAQARADMNTVARNLTSAYPDADKGSGIALVSLKDDMIGSKLRFSLLVLLGATGFVLLIACSNVANLLLARSTNRTPELAIRAALGATRIRIIRQILVENILLALIGGGLGLLIAFWATKGVLAALPVSLPRADEVGLDIHVLLFTLASSSFVGILFGLAPALKTSSADLEKTLREGYRGLSGTSNRAGSTFIVVEMALAFVLLASASLMFRSLAGLWSVNPGFDPHNVLSFSVSLPRDLAGARAPTIRAGLRQVGAAIGSVPGVEGISLLGGALPMAADSKLFFWPNGQSRPASSRDMKIALFYAVQPDYLRIMRIKLLRGRFFTTHDDESSPPVMVVDDAFARTVFHNDNPIGERVNIGILEIQAEIVGVVEHVKHFGLDSDATAAVHDQMYLPLYQLPDKFVPLVSQDVAVVLRTRADPGAMVVPIRHAVERMNSD